MGIVAVIEGGNVLVRPDMRSDVSLSAHIARLRSLAPSTLPVSSHRIQPAIVTPVNPPDGSGGGDACATIGSQCGGLTVIGVVSASSGSSSLLGSSSSQTYDNFQTIAAVDGDSYSGPIYVAKRFLNCASSAAASVFTNLTTLAETIVGGAAGAYMTTSQISAVLGSAKAFITGAVSAAAFWDVLAAVVGSVTLANLLIAIGGALTIAIVFETIKCEFSSEA